MTNKKLLLYTLGLLFLPSLVRGQTIGGIVNSAVQTTLFIASGVVVILWVITGLLFVMARGAPEKINQARTALFSAIAGTLLVIVANSAIFLVGQAFGL